MKADCRHHYLIPTEGIVATGVCKLCGAEKPHLNSPEEVKWGAAHVKKLSLARMQAKKEARR